MFDLYVCQSCVCVCACRCKRNARAEGSEHRILRAAALLRGTSWPPRKGHACICVYVSVCLCVCVVDFDALHWWIICVCLDADDEGFSCRMALYF